MLVPTEALCQRSHVIVATRHNRYREAAPEHAGYAGGSNRNWTCGARRSASPARSEVPGSPTLPSGSDRASAWDTGAPGCHRLLGDDHVVPHEVTACGTCSPPATTPSTSSCTCSTACCLDRPQEALQSIEPHHPGNAAHAPSAAVAIRFRSSKPTYSPPPHLACLLKAPLTRGRCQVSGYLNHASPQELQAPVRLPAHGRAPAPCSDRRAGAAPGSVSAHPALVGAGRVGNRIDTRWGAP